jgi:hypothetical protein
VAQKPIPTGWLIKLSLISLALVGLVYELYNWGLLNPGAVKITNPEGVTSYYRVESGPIRECGHYDEGEIVPVERSGTSWLEGSVYIIESELTPEDRRFSSSKVCMISRSKATQFYWLSQSMIVLSVLGLLSLFQIVYTVIQLIRRD